MTNQPTPDASTNTDIGMCNLLILDYLDHVLKEKVELLPKAASRLEGGAPDHQ